MRKVVSIIFAVIAGFFIYTLDVLVFIQMKSLSVKLVIMDIYTVLAGISLLISLTIMRFQDWKKRIALVLLGATATVVFGGITLICVFTDPTFQKLLKPEQLAMFSDYLSGGVWNTLLAIVGVWLWQSSKSSP